MEGNVPVAETFRMFRKKGCSALRMLPGKTLSVGMTVRIVHDATGIGGMKYHDSTQEITSIQVDHESRQSVIREDGPCAIKIQGAVPPNGSTVFLVQDE